MNTIYSDAAMPAATARMCKVTMFLERLQAPLTVRPGRKSLLGGPERFMPQSRRPQTGRPSPAPTPAQNPAAALPLLHSADPFHAPLPFQPQNNGSPTPPPGPMPAMMATTLPATAMLRLLRARPCRTSSEPIWTAFATSSTNLLNQLI